MLIKYKGVSSTMLRDLALRLSVTIDMKLSEDLLKIFFQEMIKDLSSEELVYLISGLPSFLKPFCYKTRDGLVSKASLKFYHSNQKKITDAILQVFEGYLNQEVYMVVRGKYLEVIRIDSDQKAKAIAA
ncbi:MAG: hypothetical protein NVV82_09785 [Sporocytophaga sp.]|nr:hypothetical protein [Sporocytophaga sp.]